MKIEVNDWVAVDFSSERVLTKVKELVVTTNGPGVKLEGWGGSFPVSYSKLTFIKSLKKSLWLTQLGGCYLNGVGFDLYVNSDLTATVRPKKFTNDVTFKEFIRFESVDAAWDEIRQIGGESDGAALVDKLKTAWL